MADGEELIILGEQVVCESGSYRQVRRYVKGKHPHLGKLQIGWSGDWETVWECDIFQALIVHKVE